MIQNSDQKEPVKRPYGKPIHVRPYQDQSDRFNAYTNRVNRARLDAGLKSLKDSTHARDVFEAGLMALGLEREEIGHV